MLPTIQLSAVYGTPVFTLRSADPLRAKRVYAGSYDGRERLWRFPAFFPFHRIVLKELKKEFPDLYVDPEAAKYVALVEQPVALPLDFEFKTPPYQHQREGLLHLLRHLRAGLFYAPGLGKCKITVDLHRLTGDRMLILCPRVMLDTWPAEFRRHGDIDDVIVIRGAKLEKLEQMSRAITARPLATVVTYATAARYAEELIKIPYTCIVADESHQLKTHDSARTKAAISLAQRARRRVLLSGTPSLGSPYDLYPQLRFLAKYMAPEEWWQFRKKFGVFYEWEENEAAPRQVIGYRNFELLNKRVQLVGLRRTKEECLDLPKRTTIDVPFAIEEGQKTTYNELVSLRVLGAGEEVRAKIIENQLSVADGPALKPYVLAEEAISLLNKVDQASSGFVNLTTKNPGICNGCARVSDCTINRVQPYTTGCAVVQKKNPPVVFRTKQNARLLACREVLENLLADPVNKVIVWANFIEELNDLEELVKELEVPHVRVQGGTSSKELEAAVAAFSLGSKDADVFRYAPEAPRVYLAQVATGIGITLNAAQYMIYYNLPWSLEHYLQSLDRNYRIGQTQPVVVYRLIGRHTIDESKQKALDQKIDFAQLVVSASICATCDDYYTRCHRFGIKLYDAECRFEREMMKETATIGRLP